jgi:acyl-CoA thioester hydrolase
MEPSMSGESHISVETDFRVEFYDVDSMRIAWHGTYPKFLEIGRCAILDKLGYGYDEMEQSGYAWPVVDMRIKYLKPLVFKQVARIRSTLLDYENRIRIGYLIFDPASGTAITKGESVQMAVDMKSGQSLFASPECFLACVRAQLAKGSVSA